MENEIMTLEKIAILIENEIKNSLNTFEPENLYYPISYLLEAGGKRLRPVLLIVANGLVGGNIKNVLEPAVAFELLHNFTLIHDDIMDKSPTRRGRETIHNKWGDAIGILSGDLLLAIAFKKIIKSVPEKVHKMVINTFNDAFLEVCEGQGFDLDFETKDEIKESDYFNMIYKKTAVLIEKSLVAGGQIGNANDEQIKILSEIGRNLGFAFQLQDDLLDLTASSKKFGKEIGKDLQEGKKTLIMIKAKEFLKKQDEVELLNKFYREKGLHGEDINKMIDLLTSNGIFDIIKDKIDEYFNQIDFLMQNFESNTYKNILEKIIANTLKRDF